MRSLLYFAAVLTASSVRLGEASWTCVAVCGGRFGPARTAGADTSTVSTATTMAIDVITMLAQGARSCGTHCIEPDGAMCAILRAWAVR